QIDGNDYPFARLGDSDALQLGDWVLAIGEQRGMTQSVSAGIISSEPRRAKRWDNVAVLQAQVPADGGNIGGPLVNLNGDVVGIVSYIPSRRGEFGVPPADKAKAAPSTFGGPAFEGITLAVPSNHIKKVVARLEPKAKKISVAEKVPPTPEV